MIYLLDASVLYPLIVRYGRALVETRRSDIYATDLAIYELGNALWKEHKLGIITEEQAIRVAKLVKELISRNIVNVVSYTQLDLDRVLRIAITYEGRLTFYDAPYIAAAEVLRATLATEDNRLKNIGGKFISIIGYEDLVKQLSLQG